MRAPVPARPPVRPASRPAARHRRGPRPAGTPGPRRTPSRRLVALLAATVLPAAGLVVASAAVPAGAATTTVVVSADTYVQSDRPTRNNGKATTLGVDGSPVKTTLLRFTVSGLTGTPTKVVLRLYCAGDASVSAGQVRTVTTSWSETGVTWTTAPAPDPLVLGQLGKVTAKTWYPVDVTGVVTGNGTYAFALTSTNADGATFASREAGAATAPRLLVTTADGTTGDTTPPTVAVTSPWSGATAVGSGVTLTADAADDVAVTSVGFAVDGTPVGSPDTVAPYRLDWDSRAVPDGPHTLTATAVDTAGHATTSTPVALAVSNPASPCAPAATSSAPPARYAHVVWVWFENHGWADVLGPAAVGTPFATATAARCGSATRYLDSVVPAMTSLPHYLAATSGSNCVTGYETVGTGCITDNADPAVHRLPTTSLFEQVAAAGGSWRAYQEDMPSACAPTSSGLYTVRHNPPPYYTGLAATCAASDLSFPGVTCTASGCTVPRPGALLDDVTAGRLPTFAFVTPNLCNGAHDCTPAVADRWLETWLPRITSGPDYLRGDTLVVVTYDEGSSGGTPIPAVFLSPWTPPTSSAVTANHFALLRTTQQVLGLVPAAPYLGCASGLQPGTTLPCPAGWDADLRTALRF